MPPDRGLGRRFSWANAATSLDDPTPVQKRWRGTLPRWATDHRQHVPSRDFDSKMASSPGYPGIFPVTSHIPDAVMIHFPFW
jgi:hypothetical protein